MKLSIAVFAGLLFAVTVLAEEPPEEAAQQGLVTKSLDYIRDTLGSLSSTATETVSSLQDDEVVKTARYHSSLLIHAVQTLQDIAQNPDLHTQGTASEYQQTRTTES
ncbi:UNVERIFIED_CONTAM: hypothetical protein FKN15_073729 [Acipenser sinensis]